MDNVFDLGKQSYEKHEHLSSNRRRQLTNYEKVVAVFDLLWDLVKLIFLSIPVQMIKLIIRIFYAPKKSVEGQIVLITGGGNGLGREIALRFAAEKSSIAIADIDIEGARRTVEDIRNLYNVDAKAYEIDISDYESIKQLKKQITNDLGPVDILINNAAFIPTLSVLEGTEREIERIININISSHFYTVRAFLPDMIKQKRGHIVGISSLAAFYPVSKCNLYYTTKAAVRMFMLALYEELRMDGHSEFVKVTCIHPYFIKTRKQYDLLYTNEWSVLSATDAANKIVDAILKNKLIFILPKVFVLYIYFLNLLPFEIRELIRKLTDKRLL